MKQTKTLTVREQVVSIRRSTAKISLIKIFFVVGMTTLPWLREVVRVFPVDTTPLPGSEHSASLRGDEHVVRNNEWTALLHSTTTWHGCLPAATRCLSHSVPPGLTS